MSLDPSRLLSGAVLLAILLLAALLRGYALGEESLYFDEWASTQHLDAPTLAAFLHDVRATDPPMVPLFFALEYGWSRAFGTEHTTLRLLSLVCNLLAIPLLYTLGRLLYGRIAGLVAAGIFSVSLPGIYYAQEIRPYSLVLLLALVAMLSLWQATQQGRRGAWALNVAANSLLLFTHLFTCWLLLAQGLFVLGWALSQRRWRIALIWPLAHVPAVALAVAWLMTIDFAALEVAAEWREHIDHGYLQLLGDFLQAAGAGVPMFRDMPVAGGVGYGGLVWRIAGVLLVAYAALAAWRIRRDRALLAPMLFLATLFVVPIAAQFLFSATVYACHSSRYVLYTSAPFAIMLGGLVRFLPGPGLRVALVVTLACLYALGLALHPRPLRADFQAASGYLVAEGITPADRLFVRLIIDVPALAANGQPALAQLPTDSVLRLEEVPGALQTGTRWMVINLFNDTPAALVALETQLQAQGWRWARESFGAVRPVYVYRMSGGPTP